jgi:hypothetical protein
MTYSKLYERLYSWRANVAASFSEFFAFLPNRFYLVISLLLQAISWFISYYIYKNLTGSLLVLHYNTDFGINWIGDAYNIFYFPLVSLAILIISLIILFIFGPNKHFRFQSHVIMTSVIMSNLGILSALAIVYLMNFK